MSGPSISPPRVVIAGGGTGGHLMPGLAVARALRQAAATRCDSTAAAEIIFIGTARGLEATLVPAAGFELRLIAVGGLKGGSAGRRLRTLLQLPAAIAASARLLRQARAQVVLGIGGYASGPVLAAAALLRVPIVALEVNAKTGLANRWAARWVSTAAVNFPETARDFPRAVVTGVPVRPEFFAARAVARHFLLGSLPLVARRARFAPRPETPAGAPGISKLPPSVIPDAVPQVLVCGGSQGAHALNVATAAMAPQVAFRLLHQTGPADLAAVAAAYAPLGGRAQAVAFLDDMAGAMAAADVVVCRAGASTLAELAAARRAAILVPFPAAADQHQLRNAQAYARAGAAVLLEQSQLTPERLAETLQALLADAPRRTALQAAVAQFAHPGAADTIAQLVLAARKSG